MGFFIDFDLPNGVLSIIPLHRREHELSLHRRASDTISLKHFQTELDRLVEQFGHNLSHYKSSAYDEASLRNEFLNPFFRALGWDVENKAGNIPQHREVEIESRTEIAGRKKRADYLFRTDRTDRFVCEAKKPAEELHAGYAFQAKRYAWNKGLVLAVLSDFEEMKIYVVGSRPHPDELNVGLWKSYTFQQYPLVAQELWELLSRPAVADGSIEKLIEQLPKKQAAKGKAKQQWLFKPDRTRALDVDFLNFLDEARRELAQDLIHNNNKENLLEGTRLNEAVQHILDRLLFLRICEDRDIDTGHPLALIVKSWRERTDSPPRRKAHQTELQIAEERDETKHTAKSAPEYSLWRDVVTHFRALDRRPPSHIPFFNGNLFKPHFSEDLEVSNKWIAEFLDEVGDDESPYLFNVIPVEILGTIYERFLGKVVRPHGRGAVIEEKPEVRKAGGVYYTPRYIVDYIVEQTVGKLLEGIEPKESLKLRILDPACGSGSFLIRAFERICECWQAEFTKNPALRRERDCWTDPATKDVHLTTRLKRTILTACIYGVDIDPGAVEVTQLSLYLKMLEGENRTTLARERDIFGHGNEVAMLPPLQDNIKNGNSLIASDFSIMPDDLMRVKAFDWNVQFSDIIKTGGFDAVIGNPPYILLQTMDERSIFTYLSEIYRTARYKIDTYQVFIECALDKTKNNGRFGFITPNSFLQNKHAIALRSLILDNCEISSLRTFYYPVFKGASVDTCILVSKKVDHPDDASNIIVTRSLTQYLNSDQIINQKKWNTHPEKFFFLPGEGKTDELIEKISLHSTKLGAFATAYFGIQTFNRDKYVTTEKSLQAHRPVIDGVNIQRYDLLPGNEFVDFRPASIKSGGKEKVYNKERIGVRQIGKTPICTIIPAKLLTLNTIYNIFFTKKTKLSLRFILGILSSTLGQWYWTHRFFDQKETFPKIKKDALLSIPIIDLDLTKTKDNNSHDTMVSLVNKLLSLAPKLRIAKADTEKAILQNAIAATNQQIDALVYELYGLSKEEIELVEKG